jgi:CRISPR-associated protein Cas1
MPDEPVHASAPVFARIVAEATLTAGWRRVRRNGGGPGGDGETTWHFARRLKGNIARLSRELDRGSYRTGPLRPIWLSKPDGRVRVLAVPPVRDRVAQSAAVLVLAPQLDHRMSPASFAYRAGLSVERAVALVTFYRLRGFTWVVDGDIAEFFPSILHAPLLATFGEAIECQRTRDLIARWLESFSFDGRGLAQGSPLSPLLSNLVLSPVDLAIEGKKVRLVRYCVAQEVSAHALMKKGLKLGDPILEDQQRGRFPVADPYARAGDGRGRSNGNAHPAARAHTQSGEDAHRTFR